MEHTETAHFHSSIDAIPRPSVSEVEKYLKLWNELENYKLQEEALDKLFFELAPRNEAISDILLKVATLNDFYSTNIFSVFHGLGEFSIKKIDQYLWQLGKEYFPNNYK